MRWTVLVDNRTDDARLETEHGLSVLLDTGSRRILLDTGASDLLLRNAEHLGIDLGTVDDVFISHGHSDHAGGLSSLMDRNEKVRVIVSPDAMNTSFFSRRRLLHSITTSWPAIPQERLLTVDETQQLAEGLCVIARIPHRHPMPKGNQFLFVKDAQGQYVADDFRHELALYVDGLLFTGCAHSGLENILAACPWPVRMVVGGFHLLDGQEDETTLQTLAERLVKAYPQTMFYTSHCTGDGAFAVLKQTMGAQLHTFCCGTSVDCWSLKQMIIFNKN
ncbi:MAG: MBL fold metallo-hydrolase [Prevotella sp.]|nr:MBL fold metallo-hydrolase [Prevotella sp.]